MFDRTQALSAMQSITDGATQTVQAAQQQANARALLDAMIWGYTKAAEDFGMPVPQIDPEEWMTEVFGG